jgi:hypothetical protein
VKLIQFLLEEYPTAHFFIDEVYLDPDDLEDLTGKL